MKQRQELAALREAAANKEVKRVRKKAKAPRNAVSRPGGSKRSSAPIITKDMSDEEIRNAALRQFAESEHE